MNQIFKKQSVVFTGHRSVPKDKEQEVRQQVRGKIRLLFSLGFRKFVSGMALGFDMLAAEEVIKLKEELKSGRAIEESKEEFIQRANAEGYTTYEGKKGTYGFRRAGDLRWGDRATARYYYEAQREFRELGLDITFIDGEVWWNNNGITHYKIIPEAAALDHSMVVINKNATIKTREMAGHEAFHCWKNDDCRENFIDVVPDNLIFTSEEFLNFQGPIAAAYLKDEVDVTDDSQIQATSIWNSWRTCT